MKSPRFALRSLMTAVAIAALTTWVRMLWRRSAEFAARARVYEIKRDIHSVNLWVICYDSRINPR